jgi:hypothetical protein
VASSSIVAALIALAGSGIADAPRDDAPNGCLPGLMSLVTAFTAAPLMSAGVAPNMNVAFVIDAGAIDFVSPIATGSAMSTSIGNGVIGYIAVQPTLLPNASLFWVNGTSVFESKYLGPTPATWGSPVATNLPSGSLPGAPAEISGGLRMMVAVAGTFAEYARAAGDTTWTSVPGSTLSFTDLGHPPGAISYPALSRDGLNLVYIYTATTGGGVYGAHRDQLDLTFSKGTLITFGTYSSPNLSDDCLSVYAVDGTNSHLVKLSN